ncbi:MAG: ABC transporter ATP-binding protein [Deltaproteobacteria bacterium]|nr:ABC transporter ATP-binding protein [Deltaproteobacteria bacterium]
MIRIRNLEKIFHSNRGPVLAVRGLDLEVAEGQFVVLLGPSGCGKTTTLRCVAGLERPDQGSIEIAGQVVDSVEEGTYRASVDRRAASYPEKSGQRTRFGGASVSPPGKA